MFPSFRNKRLFKQRKEKIAGLELENHHASAKILRTSVQSSASSVQSSASSVQSSASSVQSSSEPQEQHSTVPENEDVDEDNHSMSTLSSTGISVNLTDLTINSKKKSNRRLTMDEQGINYLIDTYGKYMPANPKIQNDYFRHCWYSNVPKRAGVFSFEKSTICVSRCGYYLVDKNLNIPIQRLHPYKAFVCLDNVDLYIIGDMQKYGLSEHSPDDRALYEELCVKVDMQERGFGIDDYEAYQNSLLKEEEKWATELPSYFVNFLEEMKVQEFWDDDDDSTVITIDTTESNGVMAIREPLSGNRRRVTTKVDRFICPEWCVEGFLKTVDVSHFKTFCDPCASGSVIKTALSFHCDGCEVIEYDLFDPNYTQVDFLQNQTVNYDFLICNPPYSCKTDFLLQALLNNVPFAMLLPLQTLMTKERIFLFETYHFEIFLLYPSPTFKDIRGKEVRVREIAWFYWDGRNNSSPDKSTPIKYICKENV